MKLNKILYFALLFVPFILFCVSNNTRLAVRSSDLEICQKIWKENRYNSSPSKTIDINIKSQSRSFLDLVPMEKILEAYGPSLTEQTEWLKSIIEIEDSYKNDYFVVYHACSGLSLFHDLLSKAIMAKLNITVPDDFIFMRTPWKKIYYEMDDMDDYLYKYGLPILQYCDSTKQRWNEIIFELLEVPSSKLSAGDTVQLYWYFSGLWKNISNQKILEHFDSSGKLDWILKTITWKDSKQDFIDRWKLKVGGKGEPLFSDFDEHINSLRNELTSINDNEQELVYSAAKKIQNHLLWANITLFGSYDNKGESTLHYWSSMRSCLPKDTNQLVVEALELFDLTEDSLKELQEIYKLIRKEDSVIYGIFIPKSMADKVLYICDKNDNPLKYAALKPSQIFNAYQTNIQSIEHYNILQARLVFTDKYLLNPFSGIKFVRNHTINPEKYNLYKLRLDEWAKKNLK